MNLPEGEGEEWRANVACAVLALRITARNSY
jgi:hypothetical protein